MYDAVIEFVRDLYQTSDFIPLHEPRFGGNEQRYVAEAIESTFVSSVGEFVDRFERDFAAYTGAGHAVATVNGTAAMHAAMVVAGVEPGDEVITQPLSFIATCNAISYCGARPVFVDVDRDTMGLSPAALRNWLEANVSEKSGMPCNRVSGRPLRACVVMHTFGHPARVDEIQQVCDDFGLILIEDAAESLGSYLRECHTGRFGKLGAFSFNGNKTLTTGGGGMIICDDEALALRAKHLTTTAKVKHRWDYVHDEVGFNYRMPNLNAALGCAQLEQLPAFLENKRGLAQAYREFFATSGIEFVTEGEQARANYWLNAVLLADAAQRDEFLQYTNDRGVMTRPVWRLMNRLPMYAECQCGDLANATELESRLVNIPSSVVPGAH